MVRKIKNKKLTKNKSSKNIQKFLDVLPLLLFSVILLVIIANIIWGFYSKQQKQKNEIVTEQSLLTKELNDAGKEFDAIKNSLKTSGIIGEVTRDSYCYHASRKFEVGPLYCVQKLDIVADNSIDQQTLSDFALVYNSLRKYSQFSFVSNETIQSFDDSGRIFYYQGKDGVIGCSVDFTSYGTSFGNENSKNTYSVNVECLGGEFVDPIYPMND